MFSITKKKNKLMINQSSKKIAIDMLFQLQQVNEIDIKINFM